MKPPSAANNKRVAQVCLTELQRLRLRRKLAMTGMLSAVLWCLTPLASAQEEWLEDPVTGCTVWAGDEADAANAVVSWQGACDEGKAHGEGVLSWFADGKLVGRYLGFMAEGKLDGGGIVYYRSESGEGYDRFEGRFEDGLPHGPMQIHYSNGDRFSGIVAQGLDNGKGVYVAANGDRVRGTFKDAKLEGGGITENAEGEIYRGYFKNGERSGQGVLIYANGDRYVGEFQKDAPHGKGILESLDGGVLQAEFVDGLAEGPGVFTDANGDVYTGPFVAGKPDGTFTRVTVSGETEEQVWKQGEQVK